jgi:ribosome-associated translation inhibitor RaiA
MQIQFHTGKNLDVGEGLVRRIEAEVEDALARYGGQVTRVEFHLSDENAGRSAGMDKRCTLEARPAGQQPVAVTHRAASPYEACSGAVLKLATMLESRFGRSGSRKGGDSIRHLQVDEGPV